MTSTFGGIGMARTGLNAARAALDVAGQNIANANTAGYTRQRVSTSSIAAPAQVGRVTTPITSAGQGVNVDGIARLADSFLDARVRSTAGTAGYTGVRAEALSTLEASFNEPGDQGLSTDLQSFWASWQDLSNHTGQTATGAVVIERGTILTSQISAGYRAVESQWTDVRTQADSQAAELNTAADQIASLNKTIRTTLAAGGSVNEMADQRSALAATVASLAGGSVKTSADGTVDVLVGGNPLVSGEYANHVRVAGSYTLQGTSASPAQLEWVAHPGSSVGLDSGRLAGSLSRIAPSNANGTGGVLAETADTYNKLAEQLTSTVNGIHAAGTTSTGATGLNFFAAAAGVPAAAGLSVIPVTVADLAAGKAGAGALNGSTADALSQIGSKPGSPDQTWSNLVTTTAVLTRGELQQSALADLGYDSATSSQLASASVDLDEENVNMLMQQKAYQASARVLSAMDEMLDTLINKTGMVGR